MITASPGVIIAGAASGLLVARAARRPHSSGGGYALFAAIAVGAPTGPILPARLPAPTRRSIVVFTAFGPSCLADPILACITTLSAALAALVCYGVGTSVGNAPFATIIWSRTPDGMRGLAFSRSGLIWRSMRLASLLLGGLPIGTARIRTLDHRGGAPLTATARAGLIQR
jgi:hypothetical protein